MAAWVASRHAWGYGHSGDTHAHASTSVCLQPDTQRNSSEAIASGQQTMDCDGLWQIAGLHLLGAGLGEAETMVQKKYLCNSIYGKLHKSRQN